MMLDYVWQIRVDESTLRSVLNLEPRPTHMLLVLRKGATDDSSFESFRELEERVLALFKSKVVDDFDATAWPGTRLSKGKGRIIVVELDSETTQAILSTETDLRKWVHPDLPEDICLFDPNQKHPRFMSVTHEELAWVIAPTEPPLRRLGSEVELDREMRKEMIIADAKYFCEA